MDNILVAEEGYIYTNGEAFNDIIRLGCLDRRENWYQITEEEYQAILEEQLKLLDLESL